MKVVIFPSLVYDLLEGSWEDMYRNLWEAFHELGYEVRISRWFCSDVIRPTGGHEYISESGKLNNKPLPEYVKYTTDEINPDHIYVFNHSYKELIERNGNNRGNLNLFVKPTGPKSKHFTIDTLGYGAHSSITHKKPNFKIIKHKDFYNTTVKEWINEKVNKWDDFKRIEKFIEPEQTIPEDHVLFVGQMPHDEVNSVFSFGDHWTKFTTLIERLGDSTEHMPDYPVVIKIHPTLTEERCKEWCEDNNFSDYIQMWRNRGFTVITGYDSIHNILPKTKVAVVENSTAGLECLMHNVPMISYGYPEYHWVTKDLRHAIDLKEYLEDLSWYNEYEAKSWFTWFATKYLCDDVKSTVNRLKQIL